MSKPSFVYVTYIRATPQKIWQALTDADITSRYWAHRNVSDWKPDSRWEHRRKDQSGQPDVVGTVLESDPPRHLAFSWSSPGTENDPQQASRVTYDIAEHKDGVGKLTVTHSELEEGSKMLRGISHGWPIVLSALKSFLETGKGML